MQYRKERVFLLSLCKGHIQDLLDEVGWNDTQKEIIRGRYLEFKSKPCICMALHISGTTYNREQKNLYMKLQSFLSHSSTDELNTIYQSI